MRPVEGVWERQSDMSLRGSLKGGMDPNAENFFKRYAKHPSLAET